MPDPLRPSYALFTPRAVMPLGLIGVVLVAVAAAFAWTGGWFDPGRLDQARIINTFEQANGPQPGFRRNHAKGVCLAGWFDSNGAAARVSTAQVFKPGRMPVFGRFSLAGGMPSMPDGPDAIHSMALNFVPTASSAAWHPGGASCWRALRRAPSL